MCPLAHRLEDIGHSRWKSRVRDRMSQICTHLESLTPRGGNVEQRHGEARAVSVHETVLETVMSLFGESWSTLQRMQMRVSLSIGNTAARCRGIMFPARALDILNYYEYLRTWSRVLYVYNIHTTPAYRMLSPEHSSVQVCTAPSDAHATSPWHRASKKSANRVNRVKTGATDVE